MTNSLRTLAVIGAGTMGADVAVRFAASGCKVYLVARPGKSRDSFAARAELAAADLGTSHSDLDITLVSTISELPWPELDLVIENVKEDLAVKQAVFRELVALAEENTPLASNSSTFSVRAIGESLGTGERMLGLHFFMPAHLVPLVEVVMSDWTDPRLAQAMYEQLAMIGFKPIMVRRDVPGFIANRLQAALSREAWSLIDDGVALPEDIDCAVRYGFGFRYLAAGPVMQKELSGLDVTTAAATILYPDLCNDDAPRPILTDKIARGDFGMKTGKGFWEWSDAQVRTERERYIKTLRAALRVLQDDQAP